MANQKSPAAQNLQPPALLVEVGENTQTTPGLVPGNKIWNTVKHFQGLDVLVDNHFSNVNIKINTG